MRPEILNSEPDPAILSLVSTRNVPPRSIFELPAANHVRNLALVYRDRFLEEQGARWNLIGVLSESRVVEIPQNETSEGERAERGAGG